MVWISLTESRQLQDIITLSKAQDNKKITFLLFKHSTRCSISSMALNRLESRWQDIDTIKTYYLDLLQYRSISDEIAEVFNIQHASPQVLLIKNGSCFYHVSHSAISAKEIMETITAN